MRIGDHLQNVRSCTSRDLDSKESMRGGGIAAMKCWALERPEGSDTTIDTRSSRKTSRQRPVVAFLACLVTTITVLDPYRRQRRQYRSSQSARLIRTPPRVLNQQPSPLTHSHPLRILNSLFLNPVNRYSTAFCLEVPDHLPVPRIGQLEWVGVIKKMFRFRAEEHTIGF